MLKNSKFNNRLIITIGVMMSLVGICLISNNYFQSKVLKAYNNMNLQVLALNDSPDISDVEEILSSNDEDEIVVEEVKVEEIKPQVSKPKIQYVASLSIPKISLEQGLTAMNSKYNSVDYGIQIINGSDFPNVSNGNLILASHSGTSYRSIFKNLYNVTLGDICIVTYKGKEYKYKITNIYNKPKIGKITIDRDYNKNTLTLITCTRNSDTEQTIYIGELI